MYLLRYQCRDLEVGTSRRDLWCSTSCTPVPWITSSIYCHRSYCFVLSVTQPQQLLRNCQFKVAFKCQPVFGLLFKGLNKVKIQGDYICLYSSGFAPQLCLSSSYVPADIRLRRPYWFLSSPLVTWVVLTPQSELVLRVKVFTLYRTLARLRRPS